MSKKLSKAQAAVLERLAEGNDIMWLSDTHRYHWCNGERAHTTTVNHLRGAGLLTPVNGTLAITPVGRLALEMAKEQS